MSAVVEQTDTAIDEMMVCTQPTQEEVDRAKQTEEIDKGKKKDAKSQWGPTITLRRSTSKVDDGKTMMDKAQEFKRKWNLEDNTSKTSKTQHKSTKAKLISIANDLNIVGVDGNPNVLDRMISLDEQRTMNNKNSKNSSSLTASTSTGLCDGEKGKSLDDKELSEKNNPKDNVDEISVVDQVEDLVKIGPKKKKKYKSK